MKVLDVLSRVYLNNENLISTIKFYEMLFGEKCKLCFSYTSARLEIAQVGKILLIAGKDEDLEPFRPTVSTFLVDSLFLFKQHLEKNGAQIISPPKEVPTGRNMRVRHFDGLVVEYVEHIQAMIDPLAKEAGQNKLSGLSDL